MNKVTRSKASRLVRGIVWFGILVTAAISNAQASAIVNGFDSNVLSPNDDGSTGLVNLGFEANFFGVQGSAVYVNNNGNVTFDQSLFTFTPFDLTSTGRQIIAPFFADVDTRAAGDPVTYGTGTFNGRPAFGVNWVNVDYFSSSASHTNRNSFQLILVDRSDIVPGDFDIVFNYDQIQWETGQASGSDPNGRGGSSARVGYSNGTGDPGTFFELPGSAVNGAFLDGGSDALISDSINSSVDGRYIFAARSGTVVTPETEEGTIIWHNGTNGQTSIWHMQGVDRVRVASPGGISNMNWSLIGLGDFDRSDETDFFWRAPFVGAGQNRIWLLEDDEISTAGAIPAIGPDWEYFGSVTSMAMAETTCFGARPTP